MTKKTTSKGKMAWMNGLFYAITSRAFFGVVAALLILSYISFTINPAHLWVISLAGLAFMPLLILNLILMIWAIFRGSRIFLVPFVALLPCLFFVGRYVQIESDDEFISKEDEGLTMISYNVGRFMLPEDDMSQSECLDAVFEFLKEQDADIICIQEFYLTHKDFNSLKSFVAKRLRGYRMEYYMFPTRNGHFGNITLSKTSITNKGVIKFDQSANLALFTDHKVGDQRFRVYNCHFESYNISFNALAKAVLRSEKDVFANTGVKMKQSISRRPKQVDKVLSDIEDCPIDAFVCGDFNDNPMSYTYSRLCNGRNDSFVEAGQGFGATYSFMWPMLRLDYILVPEVYDVFSHVIPKIRFSDHYPVISKIEL